MASGRPTSSPAIVPETAPSKCTAEASRVAWSERAIISLGSVTWSGGTAGASGPTPNTRPTPNTATTRRPSTARPARARDLVIRVCAPWRAPRAPVDPCVGVQARASWPIGQTGRREDGVGATPGSPIASSGRHRDREERHDRFSPPPAAGDDARRAPRRARRAPAGASPVSAAAQAAYDFNGDGYTDLAIGAPGESVRGAKGGAGAVTRALRIGGGPDRGRRPALEPGHAGREGRAPRAGRTADPATASAPRLPRATSTATASPTSRSGRFATACRPTSAGPGRSTCCTGRGAA